MYDIRVNPFPIQEKNEFESLDVTRLMGVDWATLKTNQSSWLIIDTVFVAQSNFMLFQLHEDVLM